jgi:hypothetical protein
MKTKILQKIFVGLTAGFAALAPSGAVCPTPWQVVANMPSALEGAAAASDGTYSYHAGGYSGSQGGNLNTLRCITRPLTRFTSSAATRRESTISLLTHGLRELRAGALGAIIAPMARFISLAGPLLGNMTPSRILSPRKLIFRCRIVALHLA